MHTCQLSSAGLVNNSQQIQRGFHTFTFWNIIS